MEVLLENIRFNYHGIKNHVKRRVIVVLKANAYGLGVTQVAWTLKKEGADFFAAATPDEALELRNMGINDPVLILGSSPYDAAGAYVKEGISVALTDKLMAEALSREAVRQGRSVRVHLKIDTGMGRIGFLPGEVRGISELLRGLPGIDVEGIFTHFATSDEADLSYTHRQFRIFRESVETARSAGLTPRMIHCCNSGAVLADLSEMFCDAVRTGHMLYGLNPSKECGSAVSIKPCFEIKTSVGVVRELPEGSGISYGLTHKTTGTTTTAILPIGYADGYTRLLSNRADVLIRGRRCRVLGNVCMDQTVVDVSNVPGVKPGDEAVLIGGQGDEFISVDEIADKFGAITGMIPLMFTARVPRTYVG
jgi:alanine racemase